jgi:hypothetical protein
MLEPRQIIEENDSELSIVWSDEAETKYNAADLRRACPCAGCINEWTGEKTLKAEKITDDLSFSSAILFMLVSYASMAVMLYSMIDSRGQINPNAIFPLYGVIFGEGIVIAVILGCIHAFITFAFPLIVERGMNGWDAVKLSAKAVWANLSGVVGLILGEFVIGFVGYLVCGVGLYFVLPLLFAGVLVAYRKVFPSAGNQNFNPPPPDAFRGAGSYN